MDGARASLTDGKRGMTTLTERVQSLQSELTQSDLRRGELEAELAHTQEVRGRERKNENERERLLLIHNHFLNTNLIHTHRRRVVRT